MRSFFSRSFFSSPLLLASAVALASIVVACGGSTADVPGSGTPAETPTTTTPTDPPPGTPATTPPSTPTSTPTATPKPTPPSVPTTPPSTPPANPAACNALVNSAGLVVAMQIAANAPAPIGGAIANGTYHLDDVTLYTGPGGATGALPLSIKQTIAINGSTADAIADFNGKTVSATATFVASGTSVTSTGTCPSAGSPEIATYSATATSVVMYKVNDVGQTVGYTYTK
jgi:hypothetical protein